EGHPAPAVIEDGRVAALDADEVLEIEGGARVGHGYLRRHYAAVASGPCGWTPHVESARVRNEAAMTVTTSTDAAIGQAVDALDTPVLWVDLDALEHNIATMARITREQGVDWRPHVKASKAPDLARRLIEGGACGITCAKV